MRFRRREDFLIAHDQRRPRPVRDQPAAQERAVGRHRIADDLARKLPGQIELDPARQRIGARERHVELARGKSHGPALHQQRQQDHDEGDVEKQVGRRQADQQRDRGEEDADRAAQADPGHEQFSRHWKPNGARQRNTAAGRAISISTSATAIEPKRLYGQAIRPGEQAEQHEHHDLRQPGHGIEKDDNGIVRAGLPVADHQPGEIDREKTRGMHDVGESEDDQRADRHERRVQALRQLSRLSTQAMTARRQSR